jgi:hypothetical protein
MFSPGPEPALGGRTFAGKKQLENEKIKLPSNVDVKNALVGFHFSFTNWWNKEIFRSKPHMKDLIPPGWTAPP